MFAVLMGAGAILLGCQSRSPEPFLALSGPKDLTRLEVRDTRGDAVWSIEAIEPRTLTGIFYGVVPEGFVQMLPEAGTPPRPLMDGEVLVTTTVTLRRRFTHYGFARGTQGFQVNYSKMENLRREDDAGDS